MKENKFFEFFKYLLKRMMLEPVYFFINIGRELMYPKAWFYALFTIFVLKIIWVRDQYPSVDTALGIALIVLIVWQEYRKWYDEWIHQKRVKDRERAQELMKGK